MMEMITSRSSDSKVKFNVQDIYKTNKRARVQPAKFPEPHRIIADHILDAIVETIDTKCPWDRNTFKEYQKQQTETTDGIRI